MRNFGGMALGIAGLVFAVSAVVFGATVVDAVRVEEVSVSPDPVGMAAAGSEASNAPARFEGKPQGSLRGTIYPQVSDREILDAVNQDLFQPDRTPPLDRYLFPNERATPIQNSRNDRRRREPNLRIVGTAIAGDLAIVMVQLEDSIPFAVLLGEEVDGFRVAAVGEESVTLTGDDSEFTLPVMEPQRGRSSNNRNRNARDQNATEDAARALTERVQQMLQGVGRGQMMRGGAASGDVPGFRFQPSVPVQNPGGGQLPNRGGRPGGGGGSGGETGGGGERLP